jgi:hypothetical protein
MMRYQKYPLLTLLLAGLISFTACNAQDETGKQLLKLEKEISLPAR